MSGQSFLELLEWHPRDLDTLKTYYLDRASESRMAEERARIREMTGG